MKNETLITNTEAALKTTKAQLVAIDNAIDAAKASYFALDGPTRMAIMKPLKARREVIERRVEVLTENLEGYKFHL